MTEIIISFFCVIGISLLIVHFLDYLFYRKYTPGCKLIVDLRKKNREEAIEVLELIGTVRSRKSGSAAIGDLILLIDGKNEIGRDEVYRYLRVFSLPGTVYSEDDQRWKESY